MSEIWTRLPSEPPVAFDVFRRYRDMPTQERSLDAVTNELRGNTESPMCPSGRRRRTRTRRIQHWSVQWRWVERAAAWDANLDQRVQAAFIDAAIEMAQRHAAVARGLQEKAIRRLVELRLDELRPADVLRYMIAGCRLEAESVEMLTRLLAMRADAGACTAAGADVDAGDIIITRSDASLPMETPELDAAALPFAAETATALAG